MKMDLRYEYRRRINANARILAVAIDVSDVMRSPEGDGRQELSYNKIITENLDNTTD